MTEREDESRLTVRVRGIYATALTRRTLEAGHSVVQASPAIEARFETAMPTAPADVRVDQTADRLGIAVAGDPNAVETATELYSDGLDAIAWADPTPQMAVFEGVVDRTKPSGAMMTLPGGAEGFLPFDAADTYVDVGDYVRVQVRDPTPPWSDHAPRLDTTLSVPMGLLTLQRGHDGPTVATDGEDAMELVRSTDLLSATPPEGWGIRWRRAATDASLDARETALTNASALAETIEAALTATSETIQSIAVPQATRWIRFGRESRASLDERRRAVVPTMRGHHRIKVTGESAATAVDFVESLCDPLPDSFPFAAVSDLFGPIEGDQIRIEHGKPDGRSFSLGTGQVTGVDVDGTVTVRRELSSSGTYDALGTDREPGDVAVTKFVEGRWWYPTVYRGTDGTRKGTYVNVCTPVEIYPDAARYVDLHIDVIRRPDGHVEQVDDDELEAATVDGPLTTALADRARAVAASVEEALASR